nr:hypothetical protein CFP56_52443 [Quercus suber]
MAGYGTGHPVRHGLGRACDLPNLQLTLGGAANPVLKEALAKTLALLARSCFVAGFTHAFSVQLTVMFLFLPGVGVRFHVQCENMKIGYWTASAHS